MARLDEPYDTLESPDVDGRSKSHTPAGDRAATKNVGDEKVGSDEENKKDEEEEDEEEEEEYEIEAILDSKRGMFKKGEMGYLVKWKGYSAEHNSWVSEEDAGNAQDLINEYLQNKAKAKAQSARLSAARGQKSTSAKKTLKNGKGGSPDAESVSVSTSKRNRGRATLSDDEDEDEEEEEARKKKKKRDTASTNGKSSAKRGPLATLDRTDDEDALMLDANGTAEETRVYTTMKELKLGTMKSWEEYVKEITTVEQNSEGGLMIFFETTDGKHVREPSSVCRKRFPQKLITFYESNLRWRMADGDVDS